MFKEMFVIEVCTIKTMMEFYRRNQSLAARELGINRGTLRSYLELGGEQLVKVIREDNAVVGFEVINK